MCCNICITCLNHWMNGKLANDRVETAATAATHVYWLLAMWSVIHFFCTSQCSQSQFTLTLWQRLMSNHICFYQQLTRTCGNCDALQLEAARRHASPYVVWFRRPCQVWSCSAYPLPYYSILTADMLRYTVTLTSDPMTLTFDFDLEHL